MGGLLSTICVVPMFKICAKSFNCVQLHHGQPFLRAAPSVPCYEGNHRMLMIGWLVLGPLYFFVLVPHAVVAGDLNYVKRDQLFNIDAMKEHAKRKATLRDSGPLHPLSEHIFATRFATLIVQIALPCITILTMRAPLVQTTMV